MFIKFFKPCVWSFKHGVEKFYILEKSIDVEDSAALEMIDAGYAMEVKKNVVEKKKLKPKKEDKKLKDVAKENKSA